MIDTEWYHMMTIVSTKQNVVDYRAFSRDVIAAILVSHEQKISH
jgi:hypothetical protein